MWRRYQVVAKGVAESFDGLFEVFVSAGAELAQANHDIVVFDAKGLVDVVGVAERASHQFFDG